MQRVRFFNDMRTLVGNFEVRKLSGSHDLGSCGHVRRSVASRASELLT